MRTREEVQREIDLAQNRLDRLVEELDDAFAIPDEPPVGAVVKFTVQYDHGGPVYSYAALRFKEGVGGGLRWAVTGGSTRQFTWKGLIELMMKDVSVDDGHVKLAFQVAKPKDFKMVSA